MWEPPSYSFQTTQAGSTATRAHGHGSRINTRKVSAPLLSPRPYPAESGPAHTSTWRGTVFLPVQRALPSPASPLVSPAGCSHGCSHLRRIAARTGQMRRLPGPI